MKLPVGITFLSIFYGHLKAYDIKINSAIRGFSGMGHRLVFIPLFMLMNDFWTILKEASLTFFRFALTKWK